VAQDRDSWGGGTPVNAVMKPGVPLKCGEFLD